MQNIAIVGTGRMGCALALALDEAGYNIATLIYREHPPRDTVIDVLQSRPSLVAAEEATTLDADIVLITTQDGEIGNSAERLAAILASRPAVLHSSGSLSSDVLSDLKHIGCATGSMHPLLSVSDPVAGAQRFRGAYFCIEGDPKALSIAEKLVDDLGGTSFAVDANRKALYHAAAVTSSGHVVALVDIALEMLQACGLDRGRAQEILIPLIRSTVENLGARGPEAALTGTYARGDMQTFERHERALADHANEDVTRIFLALAARSLSVAGRSGKARTAVGELAEAVFIAQKKAGW